MNIITECAMSVMFGMMIAVFGVFTAYQIGGLVWYAIQYFKGGAQ